MTHALINGRYRMLRPLGSGSGGRVLLVEDLRHGRALRALKALAPGGDTALLRSEFAELGRLEHPNLARVFEIDLVTAEGGEPPHVLSRGTPFFTAEHVPGRHADDAADALGDDRSARNSFALRLGIGAARALAFVHARDLVHRDVKPSNLIVGADPLDVRLVDFGLALRRSATDGFVAGTLAFMAPEALGAHSDARSDLYSLGISLYRVLTGKLPFSAEPGGDLRPLLHRIMAGDAPEVAAVCPWADPALSRAVARLMSSEPGKRHASARSLLADLGRLQPESVGPAGAVIGGVVDAETETETPQARAAYVRSAGLIGRKNELARLVSLGRAALEGAGPSVIKLAGPFGSGRSRLAQEGLRQLEIEAAAAAQSAPWVLEGTPGSLAAALGCSVDPGALGERLLLVAARQPHAVVLDPNEPAGEVIAYLERSAQTTRVPLLVIAKVGAAQPGPDDPTCIELRPFSAGEIGDFVGAVTSAAPVGELAPALLEATGGLPLLVEQALLAMLRTHSVSDLANASVPSLVIPAALDAQLDAQLGTFGVELREALAALALLEGPHSLHTVAGLLDIGTAEAARRVGKLVRLGVCGMDSHDRASVLGPIAQAALREAGPRRVAELHRLAMTLRTDPIHVARHAIGAGLEAEAAELCLRAGAAAAERGDAGSAIRFYRAAAERLPASRREQAMLPLAGWTAQTGDYTAARKLLDPLARTHERAALLEAEIARRSGDTRMAEHGAAPLASSAEDSSVRLGARALRARIALDGGDTSCALERLGPDDATADPKARAAHAEVLGLLRLRTNEHEHADRAFALAAEQARLAGDSRLWARALSLSGTAFHLRGEAAAAAAKYREAAKTAAEAGDVHGEATYAINLGSALVDGGAYGEALTSYRRGIDVLVRLGANRPCAAALANYSNLLIFLGDLEGARKANRQAGEAARIVDEPVVQGYVALNQADLHRRHGEPAAAAQCYEEAALLFGRAKSQRDLAFAHVSRAELAAAEGNRVAAEAHRAAASQAAGPDARGELAVRLELLDARILQSGGSQPRQALELGRHAAERAIELGHRDLALRAWGVVARIARSSADTPVLAHACARSRELIFALTELVPDVYRQSFLDDPERRAALELAGSLAAPPEGDRTSLQGMLWRRLASVTKRLTSEHRLPVLLEYILDTAIELLRAERCFLLIRGKDGTLAIRSARNLSRAALKGEDLRISRSIAEGVANGAEPVVTVDALADGRFDGAASVQALRLRSIIAVPLRAREGLVGALYLDDRFRPGVFEPADVELAQELADQAAIAIENARLHAENRRRARRIEALNRRLSRTVESQRTAIDQIRGALDRSLHELETKYSYGELVGRSAAMTDVLRLLDRITDSDVPVIVQGESGTGKELVARAVHFNGSRRGQAFVPVNCGAFTETLLESELFGHVRGAFTGADRARTGLFEAAHQGTLFLDEIGEMSLSMQSKLLRALQEGEVRPVGGNETRKVNVRVIAATNRDLTAMVREGKFREDLFYRLNVIALRLPALRERREDIPGLCAHFLRKHGQGRTVLVDRKAMARLYAHSWPGNVRQLENEILRLLVLADDEVHEEHLSAEIAAGATDEEICAGDDLDIKSQVERLERRLIRRALRESRGNQTKTARALGLSRFGLQKKLRRYGLA